MTTTFETASIGDEVWCVSMGWGVIISTHQKDYPIVVEFDNRERESYTVEGRRYSNDLNQALFWDEIKFEAPTKPLPKLNKDDCIEVWDSNTNNPSVVQKRHFSHFEGGLIFCFNFGGSSWTSIQTTGWNRWRKPE